MIRKNWPVWKKLREDWQKNKDSSNLDVVYQKIRLGRLRSFLEAFLHDYCMAEQF